MDDGLADEAECNAYAEAMRKQKTNTQQKNGWLKNNGGPLC